MRGCACVCVCVGTREPQFTGSECAYVCVRAWVGVSLCAGTRHQPQFAGAVCVRVHTHASFGERVSAGRTGSPILCACGLGELTSKLKKQIFSGSKSHQCFVCDRFSVQQKTVARIYQVKVTMIMS